VVDERATDEEAILIAVEFEAATVDSEFGPI
jgi:hypothetical protein